MKCKTATKKKKNSINMESLNKLSEFEQSVCKNFPSDLNICNLNHFFKWYEDNYACNEMNINKQIEFVIITWLNVSMYFDSKQRSCFAR